MVKHPAKFSPEVLTVIGNVLAHRGPAAKILDPFAGVGGVHSLVGETWGIELEPEWATQHPRTIVGNALELPFRDNTFDCIVTSCTYGNRMADHHEAKDASRRNTYRHTLGRKLSRGSSAAMQWGRVYRSFHIFAWVEALRVLKNDGLFILNVSDHIRKGERVPVVEWHRDALQALGILQVDELTVVTRRNRFGENYSLRVENESVLVFAASTTNEG